jgi:hypothetical protein
MPGNSAHRTATKLVLGLSLLGASLSCAAMSPRVGPCRAEQLSGSWAGISERGQGVAVLLVLQADGSGRFEIWGREKGGSAANFQRRIEKWEVGGDGALSFRNPAPSGGRSITALNATSRCVEDRPSTMDAVFWIQDIAYAKVTLEPLDDFLAQRRHLEQFYRAIARPTAPGSQETQP